MRPLAFAVLFVSGCAGPAMTIIDVRDPSAIAVEVESAAVRRELLAAGAASGALPGMADATRGADGTVDVRCSACFGDSDARAITYPRGKIAFGGAATEVLAWGPDVLRVHVPAIGPAHVDLVVPKAALSAIEERREGDRELGTRLLFFGAVLMATGTLLLSLTPSTPGATRTALLATGIPLEVIGFAGVVPGLVICLSPIGGTRLYPP